MTIIFEDLHFILSNIISTRSLNLLLIWFVGDTIVYFTSTYKFKFICKTKTEKNRRAKAIKHHIQKLSYVFLFIFFVGIISTFFKDYIPEEFSKISINGIITLLYISTAILVFYVLKENKQFKNFKQFKNNIGKKD